MCAREKERCDNRVFELIYRVGCKSVEGESASKGECKRRALD